MSTLDDLIREAEKRGILDDETRSLIKEASNRGIVNLSPTSPTVSPTTPSMSNDIPGMPDLELLPVVFLQPFKFLLCIFV